ncbi:MAG: shikimate dehydrogenase [Gammaproteobacteria bacterium]|nr:shikimate dehydrogenase [Gammaproteobacteria bacterium]
MLPLAKVPLTGLLGGSVQQSKSPTIHHHWYDQLNLPGHYALFPTPPHRLAHTVEIFKQLPMLGFNVTLPYKIDILPFLDHIDEDAQIIGAVNTVVKKNHQLIGYNFDGIAYVQSVVALYPLEHFIDDTIVILGSGGATRSILAQLIKQGAHQIVIVHRNLLSFHALQNAYPHIRFQSLRWPDIYQCLPQAKLLINTTSLGMLGQKELDLDVSWLPDDAIVSDIVYNPLETTLLKKAKERGLKCVDGLGMLLYQAQFAFQQWFGIKPPVDDEVRRYVVQSFHPPAH